MIRGSRLPDFLTLVVCVAVLMLGKQSSADNPAFWTVSEGTNGEDVFWTSPTAVDVGYPRYGTTFEITRVEAFVGGTGVDVTNQLGETTGTAVTESLPVTLINGTFADPTSGTSATIDMGIDPNGFGQFAITDVTLGTIVIIFFPVQITRIEVDANITVEGVLPGDFDGDLDVDLADLGLWEMAHGVDAGADTNFDGVSDGLDFLDWQRFQGTQLTLPQVAAVAIPEPATAMMLVSPALLGTLLTRSKL